MKKTLIIAFITFGTLMLFHFILLPVNKKMHQGFKKAHADASKINDLSLEDYRIKLEKKYQTELHQFQWKDKQNGYAEIPLQRAFDYYLIHSRD